MTERTTACDHCGAPYRRCEGDTDDGRRLCMVTGEPVMPRLEVTRTNLRHCVESLTDTFALADPNGTCMPFEKISISCVGTGADAHIKLRAHVPGETFDSLFNRFGDECIDRGIRTGVPGDHDLWFVSADPWVEPQVMVEISTSVTVRRQQPASIPRDHRTEDEVRFLNFHDDTAAWRWLKRVPTELRGILDHQGVTQIADYLEAVPYGAEALLVHEYESRGPTTENLSWGDRDVLAEAADRAGMKLLAAAVRSF